ncbi:hypothetical protein FBU30_001011 [Linnemannia zychae]|nr:hypothetical protein FBU30_001011 [Linnemannia zychae]
MDKVSSLLVSFLEQQARPQIQAEVTQQLNSTKADLKNDLPNTILNYLTGKDGNGDGDPTMSQLVSNLGPNLLKSVSSVTNSTVDTASEGMDTLLTNGIMNIAKSVLTKEGAGATDGDPSAGGINFDFLRKGKEGMVGTTLNASEPVVKQVSENMSAKLSSSIPGAIGDALQSMVNQHARGASGAIGMAADMLSNFMSGNNNSADTNAAASAPNAATGGNNESIQQLCKSLLSPKIATLLKPYLAKFEAQTMKKLENELRTKVFSTEYIKSTVMGMLTGSNGQNSAGQGILGTAMNAMVGGNNNNANDSQHSGQASALNALGNLANTFLKNLYAKGRVLGFKRAKRNQRPDISLIQIEGVKTAADTEFYLGKRVAFVYRAKREVNGSKIRCIWGRVTRAHGGSGAVKARFRNNLPAKSFGASVRVMMYPSRV